MEGERATIHLPIQQIEEVSREYAETVGIDRDAVYFLLKLHEEIGELTQAFMMLHQMSRQKGQNSEQIQKAFRAEIADALCHLLLLAHHHQVDIEGAIKEKWLRYLSEDKQDLIP